jgi:hypothetical protein
MVEATRHTFYPIGRKAPYLANIARLSAPLYRFENAEVRGEREVEKIDPAATHLAEEFRANPSGPHSPALQRVLNIMRGAAIAGKHFLIHDKERQVFVLAQLPAVRGSPVIRHNDQIFATTDEAEWTVFKLRWRDHTGRTLAG